jgi:TRAP-type mannitol/chloroaromatic compound transport system substrate-binding protein
MERLNTEALTALTERFNVQLRGFPQEVITAARTTSTEVLGELGGRNAATRKVYDSYTAFRERAGAWSKISLKSVLEAREG